MRALLERWAKVGETVVDESGVSHPRLYIDGVDDGVTGGWRVVHSRFWKGFTTDPESPQGQVQILGATIEAIEARRWRYRFWGDLGMREAIVVTVDERTDGRERHGAGGPNLPVAAVLLSAYLSALEANQ